MPIESPVGPLPTVDEIRAELRATAFADLERRHAHPAMVVMGPADDWGPSTWTRPEGFDPPTVMLPPVLVSLAPRGVTGTRVTFGRLPPCDVILPFRQLSRMHVCFHRVPEGWLVEDDGSRNGTILDGKQIPAGVPVPLRSGGKLRFGDVVAVFLLPYALQDYLRRDSRPFTPMPRPQP